MSKYVVIKFEILKIIVTKKCFTLNQKFGLDYFLKQEFVFYSSKKLKWEKIQIIFSI